MPNHTTHEYVGIACTPAIIAACVYTQQSIPITAITTVCYIFSTYYLSPDLDHDVGAASYRRWGILRFLWYPYKRLIKHRSWISHSGPLSATIKLLYITCWFLPFLYTIDYMHYILYYYCLWIAIICADCIHCFLDLVWKD